jgi:voltage-gated potassium channel Kch
VLTQLLFAWCLMALCVMIHATGVTTAGRRLGRHSSRRFWPWNLALMRLAGWMIAIHLAEIVAFALFYRWQAALPDLASALYFSAVTYTTTGYGDVVLPSDWRLVGAVEALTGILMCGWSTGFFVAVIGRLLEPRAPNTGVPS